MSPTDPNSPAGSADRDALERLEQLRANPQRSALLLDVDGSLAPIVAEPGQAAVPDATRATLGSLAQRYGLVACVSGRRATDARRIVGIDAIAYSGNHGYEYLAGGSDQVQIEPRVARESGRVQEFSHSRFTPELLDAGVALEEKDSICAFHWRNANDQSGARALLERIASEAAADGLVTHWGRKVLEIRPDVPTDKGSAVARVLRHAAVDHALYAGDDSTDLDAFAGLRSMVGQGELKSVVCVGVLSDEGPQAIANRSDIRVEGAAGLSALLTSLL